MPVPTRTLPSTPLFLQAANQLDSVTDYVEEKELDSAATSAAMSALDAASQEDDAKTRER